MMTLCNLVKNPISSASQMPWKSAVNDTWAYMAWEQKWLEYEGKKEALLESTRKVREAFIANELQRFDAERAVEREVI